MNSTAYRATFGYLHFFLKPYRLRLFFSLCLATVSSILSLVPLVCVFFVVRILLTAGTVETKDALLLAVVAAGSVVLRFTGYLVAMGLSPLFCFWSPL